MNKNNTSKMKIDEEISMISQILNQEPMIESYEIDGENVKIVIDEEEVLKNMFTNKSYILTKELVDNNLNWSKLNEDSRKLLLIVLNRAATEKDMFGEVLITPEELQFEFELLNSYELEEPVLFNGYYIYYYKNIDYFKAEFVKNAEKLINIVNIVIPGTNIPEEYKKVIVGVQACTPQVTITELTGICKMSENEVVEVLWDMAKKGFLRIRD